jgi:Ca2+-transporting ATPase
MDAWGDPEPSGGDAAFGDPLLRIGIVKLVPHLDAGLILLDAEQNSREILRLLAERIAAARGVLQRDDFLREIAKDLVENRIEDVTLGHALLDEFGRTAIAIAISGRPPRAVSLLVLSPLRESGSHFQIVSKLEGMLQAGAFREALRSAGTPETVIQVFERAEAGEEGGYVVLDAREVLQELRTSADGLSDVEASKRLTECGANELRRIGRTPVVALFLKNLVNLFAVLLWIGGTLAFVARMPELGIAIFAVILVNAVFSFWQEYKAERAVDALRQLIPSYARVIRGGREQRVPASLLVPGDLILIEAGDRLSADARLIEASNLRIDNSSLTGESKPVYKMSEPVPVWRRFLWVEIPNVVFAGTMVVAGRGKAVVIATGMETEIGRIARLTQVLQPEVSPIQHEMRHVTRVVALLAVAMGLTFFVVGNLVARLTPLESFLFAIGIIVANIPEGLLPTLSLALAMGVQRMARRNALIKRLSAVETLGCATVICTDKTGTLTLNEMAVVKLWTGGEILEIPAGGVPCAPASAERSHLLDRLWTAASLCNDATLVPASGTGGFGFLGDPTEGALLVFSAQSGFDVEKASLQYPRVFELPFEPIRKRMTTIHRAPDGQVMAFTKGAPRELLGLCRTIRMAGETRLMSAVRRRQITAALDELAAEGLRVLAVAERELPALPEYAVDEVERDLTFLGLVGMMDPPRPEVPHAVELCRRAGIRVIMITGDYGVTALAVGRRIGLIRDGAARAIEGTELQQMSDDDLRAVLSEDQVVFSRMTPEQKLRVVTVLQERGEIIAVTGDGVNDAPALKKADIGIAMGQRGTDVAREAAAMVLLDDNFASIVAAVEEGRAVYANIKKFVTYIFASNVPEIVPFLAFVVFRIPLPLTVMQILAVDLGTDLVPALGLGAEPPEPGIMDRPPRPRGTRLLDRSLLLRAYGFLGALEAVACMAAFFSIYLIQGWRPGAPLAASGPLYVEATTMTLAAIVFAQVGNVFACRTERESTLKVGLLSNRLVLFGIVVELTLLILLMQSPVLQTVFGVTAIHPVGWAVLLIFPCLIFFAEEARKALVRRSAS